VGCGHKGVGYKKHYRAPFVVNVCPLPVLLSFPLSLQGAEVGNFQTFEKEYRGRGVVTVCLEQNYRSSGAIVAASNAVIAVNELRIAKALRTDRPAGSKVMVVECRNAACECAFVVAEVQRRSQQQLQQQQQAQRQQKGAAAQGSSGAGGAGPGGVGEGCRLKLGDMAVLARTNATLEGIKEAFRAAGIAYASSSEQVGTLTPLSCKRSLQALVARSLLSQSNRPDL